jgi:hypothetical protein
MTDTRLKRRLTGMLDQRLREARLDEVHDRRDRRGRRWKLGTLLGTTILGLVAGGKGLLEVESLTEDLSVSTRHTSLARRARSPRCSAQPSVCFRSAVPNSATQPPKLPTTGGSRAAFT